MQNRYNCIEGSGCNDDEIYKNKKLRTASRIYLFIVNIVNLNIHHCNHEFIRKLVLDS